MSDPYVLILYYSRGGAVAELARHVARGVAAERGMEARLRSVPPVAPETQVAAPPVPEAGAPYGTLEDLAGCAALAIGSPTRFGNPAPALGHFLAGTVGLWQQGTLVGRPAGAFTASASPHGGQESTALAMLLPLLHHGMIVLGIPFHGTALDRTEGGGSPYGAGAVTGGGRSAPDDTERELAEVLGRRLASTALQLARGAR